MSRIEELRKKLGIKTPFQTHGKLLTSKISLPDAEKKRNKEPFNSKILETLCETGFSHIAPLQFERLFQQIFLVFGFKASLTRVTGDEGIDIKLNTPDGQNGIVQCKRYAQQSSVSARDIREFLGAMVHSSSQFGYYVTTTNFSTQAIEFSKDKNIYLIDGRKLTALVISSVGVETNQRSFGNKLEKPIEFLNSFVP